MIDWGAGGGRLEAGGRALEWGCWGPAPGGEPVVAMLHEGLGSLGLWRDFPARLCETTGLPVFAWSRAGYGWSDPAEVPRPLDYMTREAVDVLPEVLDAVGARRFVLLGHSDGATIAAEHAGRVADPRVRGLILMAPHFFTEPTGLAEIARAKAAFETTDLKARMARRHRDPEATFRGWNDAWLHPGFAAWDVGEVIERWRVPCLVIQGRRDQYGTLAQVREVETRSRAPVDVAVLEDCRHAPHLDRPDETLAAIAAFTSRLRRIEAAEAEVA